MAHAQSISEVTSREFIAGFRASQIWGMLAWDDIRQRYRRSILGPIWITLSMGVFTLLLGVIYSRLFHINVATYLPFLSLGYIIWGFISQTTNESCRAFQEGERILKQIKLPLAVYVLRVVWRNVIVFFHTVVIFVPIAVIFHVTPTWYCLLALPGLLLLYVNQVWLAFTLAILCSRYRDILQVVATAIQITLFATPIMWPKSSLANAGWIADINPLYHWIELVRAPILGQPPELLSWAVSVTTAIVGTGIALMLLRRASRRLVFWI